MTKQNTIAQLGHPILREKAKDVVDFHSPALQATIDKLMLCVKEAGGVGIAAPQIHISLRIFIMCSKPNHRYPDAPLMEPTVIINPEILSTDEALISDWEGCLSVPSIRGLVPRHNKITVAYFDQQGNRIVKTLTHFIARVFQHEIDHLDGITFIERVTSPRDLMCEIEWFEQFVNSKII